MLGDQICEEKGRVTSQQILYVECGIPKMETSFSATGNYRGAEGQGVLMRNDGQEMANLDWL